MRPYSQFIFIKVLFLTLSHRLQRIISTRLRSDNDVEVQSGEHLNCVFHIKTRDKDVGPEEEVKRLWHNFVFKLVRYGDEFK